MSQTNANPQDESVTKSAPAMDTPPILRLPVTLRQKIYHYATERERWPDRNPDGRRCSRLAVLEPQRRALLTSDRTNLDRPQLIYSHPLSQVSKRVRTEFSDWICTASTIPVVSVVRDLDFSHVQHFLSTLEEAHQDAFKLRYDGSSDRRLTIELQGPYTKGSRDNVRGWIDYVDAFVGPEKQAELGALYKTIDIDDPKPAPITIIVLPLSQHYDGDVYRRVPVAVLKYVHECYNDIAPGGGEIEAHKIMRTLYCWVALDWAFEPDHGDTLSAVKRMI